MAREKMIICADFTDFFFYIFRKAERVIRGPQGVTVETEGKGKVLNFCANNYLGFSVS